MMLLLIILATLGAPPLDCIMLSSCNLVVAYTSGITKSDRNRIGAHYISGLRERVRSQRSTMMQMKGKERKGKES